MSGYSGRVTNGDPLTGAERQRRYMDAKAPNRGRATRHSDAAFKAECWCHTHIDVVDPALIRQGRTWSCGARNCKEAA